MPGNENEVAAGTVCRLMAAYRKGDRQAADELVEMFYPQLRRLAASRLRTEPSGHSWQPTLLVNELYLELIKIKALQPPSSDRGGDEKSAFFGLAGLLMKRLLIHHARPLSRKVEKLELGDAIAAIPGFESVAEMETVLSRLEAIRPRLRTVVELRVFESLTAEEIAARLECAPSTVARDWSFAKHWLQRQFAPQAP
ncbi:MAG: sigma-70 family RNA polymerase sigma factor [Acidobacteria bacterium]|nr:sigma-70 family RNA polymerase sigma factor [Acidobacteriota bacterium]